MGELEPRLLQVCWEATRAEGCVAEVGTDGVLEALSELGVPRSAQCGGELLDWCGVVVPFVSVRVRLGLEHPVRGLCRRGYSGQVLQVAVECGIKFYLFEVLSRVCVLVLGMRVHTSIAVCVAAELLLEDVQGVLRVHASERHP